eukprot:203667_1
MSRYIQNFYCNFHHIYHPTSFIIMALQLQESYSLVNKLIVFDWDDTLFPTSKTKQMSNQISDVEHTQMNELSCCIYAVLSSFIDKYGARNIRIVSASEKGWIKQSLSMVANIGRFADICNILFVKH